MDPIIRTEEDTPKCAYSVYIVERRNTLNQQIVALKILYIPLQFV